MERAIRTAIDRIGAGRELPAELIPGAVIPSSPDPSGQSASSPSITLEITLDAAVDPITAYQQAVHGGGFDTDYPVLKLVADGPDAAAHYDALAKVKIVDVDIAVSVTGLRDVLVQNDLGFLAPDKPFMPFGTIPVKGSSLLVGSWEAMQKSLSDLWLTMKWQDAPTDFARSLQKLRRSQNRQQRRFQMCPGEA